MLYVVLVAILIFLVFLSYLLSHGDILNPAVLTSFAFFIASLFALIGVASWNTVDLGIEAFCILTLGVVIFDIVCWFCNGRASVEAVNAGTSRLQKWALATSNGIASWKLLIVGGFVLLTYVLYYQEIIQVNAYYGYSSGDISSTLSTYRNLTPLLSGEELTHDVSTVVLQMRKVCDVVFVVLAFSILNGFYSRKKPSPLALLLAIFCAVASLLTTGRSRLMSYVVAVVVLWVFLHQLRHGKLQSKYLLRLFFVGILAFGLFYLSSSFVGRESAVAPIDYITSYLGVGIPCFDMMIMSGDHFGFDGQEIFNGLIKIASTLGLVEPAPPEMQNWIFFSSGGANIYTSLKNYYCLGGIAGVVICQAIFALFASLLYRKTNKSDNPIFIILYAFYSYVLIDQIRAETFFKNIFSINLIIYILLILVLYWFFFHCGKYAKGNKRL